MSEKELSIPFPWSSDGLSAITDKSRYVNKCYPLQKTIETRGSTISNRILPTLDDMLQMRFATCIYNKWEREALCSYIDESFVSWSLVNFAMISVLRNGDYPVVTQGPGEDSKKKTRIPKENTFERDLSIMLSLLKGYFDNKYQDINATVVSSREASLEIYMGMIIKLIQILIVNRSENEKWFPDSLRDQLEFDIANLIDRDIAYLIHDIINPYHLRRGKRLREFIYIKLFFLCLEDLLIDYPINDYKIKFEDSLRRFISNDIRIGRHSLDDCFLNKSYIVLLIHAKC
jgi:hypothetical protein